jgi:hypothetical protein
MSLASKLRIYGPFKNQRPKAQKLLSSKFIKENLKILRGPSLPRANEQNPEQLEPSILFK